MYDEYRAGRDGGQKPSWIYTHFIIDQTGKTRKSEEKNNGSSQLLCNIHKIRMTFCASIQNKEFAQTFLGFNIDFAQTLCYNIITVKNTTAKRPKGESL